VLVTVEAGGWCARGRIRPKPFTPDFLLRQVNRLRERGPNLSACSPAGRVGAKGESQLPDSRGEARTSDVSRWQADHGTYGSDAIAGSPIARLRAWLNRNFTRALVHALGASR